MVSLQQLKDYAHDVINGTRTIERLSSDEEQGRKAGGRRNVEATLVAATSTQSVGDHQSTDDARQRQENALKQYAQAESIWFDDYTTQFGDYYTAGAEAEVYIVIDNKTVTKVNDLAFHETPLEFLDRIALHNYLFPEAPYTLIGFTERKDTNSFAVVVEQPFVSAVRGATRAEVRVEMQRRGFRSIGGNDYINDDYRPHSLPQHSKRRVRRKARF